MGDWSGFQDHLWVSACGVDLKSRPKGFFLKDFILKKKNPRRHIWIAFILSGSIIFSIRNSLPIMYPKWRPSSSQAAFPTQSHPEAVVSGERHWWTSPLERLLAQVSQEQLLAFGHLKPLNRACEIICQTYKQSSAALIWGIKEHWEGKSRKNKTWQNHDKKKGRYLWSLVAGRGAHFMKQRELPSN